MTEFGEIGMTTRPPDQISSMFEAVSTRRLYRVIADQLADKIRIGEFQVGDRLPSERELAEQLRVSRSSVREALIALEIAGQVEVRVGSGVFVTARSVDESGASGFRRHDVLGAAPARLAPDIVNDMSPFELLEVRLMLEPECAALAARHGSDMQIGAIFDVQRAMAGDGAPGSHDREFHDAIGAACGNAALASAVSHVWDLAEVNPVFERLDQHFVTSHVWELALAEHERICAAIAERDEVRARHAMTSHILGIMDRLREDAAEALDPAGRRR